MIFKKIFIGLFKVICYLLASVAGFLLLYLLLAFVFSRIIIHGDGDKGEITAYVMTNGVHTDIAVPVRTDVINWSRYMPFKNTKGKDSLFTFLAIGWGDKHFYLETPSWADLKFSTAFRAVFGLDSSALHATYFRQLAENAHCRKIHLHKDEYRQLIHYILASAELDTSNNPILIHTSAQYGSTDAFYEAKGNYNLFHTCNTWTNNALKACGKKACLWTPFESGIMRLYTP